MQFLPLSPLTAFFLITYWNKSRSKMTAAASNGLPTLKRDCTGQYYLCNAHCGEAASAGLEKKKMRGQGRGSQGSSSNGIKYIRHSISFNWQRLHWGFFASITASAVGMTCFPTHKRKSFANKTLKTKTNNVGVGFTVFSVHEWS